MHGEDTPHPGGSSPAAAHAVAEGVMRAGDTIVAIASPLGRSARGIVRASGPDAFAALRRLSAEPGPQPEPEAGQAPPVVRGIRPMRLRLPPRSTCAPLSPSAALTPASVPEHGQIVMLPCLVATFPAASGSYTGEDAFEIQVPGHPHLLDRLVDALLALGHAEGPARGHTAPIAIRRAEPGEFTARAFFNGRLTLTEAEGVAMTIAAASDAQLRAARMLTGGRLHHATAGLADRLAVCLALVEAGIDFTDQEDVVAIEAIDLYERLRSIVREIDALLARAVGAEAIAAMPRVVLVGPPNAGKSTLFNRLLGHTRAVVSPLRGTTRDVLAEPMAIDPATPGSPEIMLIDIAGLDEPPDGAAGGEGEPASGCEPEAGGDEPSAERALRAFLNPLMQHAARRAIEEADLILRITPTSADARVGSSANDAARGALAGAPVIFAAEDQQRILQVRTKIDLRDGAGDMSDAQPVDERGMKSMDGGSDQRERAADDCTSTEVIGVSAMTGAGIDRLRQAIADRLVALPTALASDTLVLLPRHEAEVHTARERLAAAIARLDVQMTDDATTGVPGERRLVLEAELIAADLRLALDALGALVGQITPDDVLGHVFSSFCVGK